MHAIKPLPQDWTQSAAYLQTEYPAMSVRPCLAWFLVFLTSSARGDETDDLVRRLKDPANARTAWEKIVAKGPSAIPRLLEAMDTPDTVSANWLRLAFDRLAESGKGIDVEALLKFAAD